MEALTIYGLVVTLALLFATIYLARLGPFLLLVCI